MAEDERGAGVADQKSVAGAVGQMAVTTDVPVKMPVAVPIPAAQRARCGAG